MRVGNVTKVSRKFRIHARPSQYNIIMSKDNAVDQITTKGKM